jgi:hypothetical protein
MIGSKSVLTFREMIARLGGIGMEMAVLVSSGALLVVLGALLGFALGGMSGPQREVETQLHWCRSKWRRRG